MNKGRRVTFAELLAVVAPTAGNSPWRGEQLDCAGTPSAADRLHDFSDQQREIPSKTLSELAEAGVQVVDGTLTAIDPPGGATLLIRAVDSTWWDVETSDDELLDRIRSTFERVDDLPR